MTTMCPYTQTNRA